MLMVERNSDDLRLRIGVAYKCVSQGHGPRKNCYPLSLGSSNDFGSRSEEVGSMPILWYPPNENTSDVVYNRRVEFRSVAELHYELMGLMGDVHDRSEEFYQRGFCFNNCRDSMSQGTVWLQTSRKERWSGLKLMRRWCRRRRPPDVRLRSSVEMGGHPFRHQRKVLRKFSQFHNLQHNSFFLFHYLVLCFILVSVSNHGLVNC